jgi:hypothetical protein
MPAMDAPAVAHEQSALIDRDDLTEGGHPVLLGHVRHRDINGSRLTYR